MGRSKLNCLFRRAGLARVRVEPIVDIDTEGDTDGWFAVVKSRIPVAVDAGAVSAEAAGRWWSELQEALAPGEYFVSLTQFAVVGERP